MNVSYCQLCRSDYVLVTVDLKSQYLVQTDTHVLEI